jgi:hypothetical protein
LYEQNREAMGNILESAQKEKELEAAKVGLGLE